MVKKEKGVGEKWEGMKAKGSNEGERKPGKNFCLFCKCKTRMKWRKQSSILILWKITKFSVNKKKVKKERRGIEQEIY